MVVPAEPQEDIIEDPIEDPASGPHPETDDDAPPVDPEAPETAGEDGPDPDDPDAESEEWQSLAKKFAHIEDEGERRRAIGEQYWEKTRYASKVRKENEALKEELEDARKVRVEEARREPDEPPPPHPDLERLDSRINALGEKDGGYFEQQQNVLMKVAEVDQQIAVVKDRMTEADEGQRATLETRLEGLDGRKENLHDKFSNLKDRREDLADRLYELQQQREWTAGLLDKQGQDEVRERQSRESFKKSFPQQVASTIDTLTEKAGLSEEDDAEIITDLKQVVKDRLTVKFWKLGQMEQVDDVDVDDLIADEFNAYLKGRDLAGRAKFGETSKKKLSVSGKRPASTPRKTTTPGRKPKSGYDAEPKDISALGTVSQAPTMRAGRARLEKRGL